MTDVYESMKEARNVLEQFLNDPNQMLLCRTFADTLVDTFRLGGNVFACGNGGSYCDSLHFCEELTGRFKLDRQPLGAIALGEGAHLTCTANDFGFEYVFERQLHGLARKNDLLVAISTSGNSENVIRAVKQAHRKGMSVVGLLGNTGGRLREFVDVPIIVPSDKAERIQEVHIKIIHSVIQMVEDKMFIGRPRSRYK